MGCDWLKNAEEQIPEFIRWLTAEDMDAEVNV